VPGTDREPHQCRCESDRDLPSGTLLAHAVPGGSERQRVQANSFTLRLKRVHGFPKPGTNRVVRRAVPNVVAIRICWLSRM